MNLNYNKHFYFLVIFIGGVAFSISHAIISREESEIIKSLAEVNHIRMTIGGQ